MITEYSYKLSYGDLSEMVVELNTYYNTQSFQKLGHSIKL